MPPDNYQRFLQELQTCIPVARIITDPLRTLAYGTDASFYRMVPKIVVKADMETEVAFILQTSDRLDIPVTFRAAGTSLSGQAITDSVLVIAGSNWKQYEIQGNGKRIRLQPGIIGGQANRYLAAYRRKIGPDPASINAAMIGGIAANNASGMCCGVAQNSYQTVHSMRIVFQDGTVLDTADAASRERFQGTHHRLLAGIEEMARTVRRNPVLAERIHHKFKIKNTTGYSLNALVDFADPIDIILHLMIGSEGTLGFISEITYDTVVEHPFKASALMIFPQMASACSAATTLKQQPVSAVELMDRAALGSVAGKQGLPAYLEELSATATALLVETRASNAGDLKDNIKRIIRSLATIPTERPIEFTDREEDYTRLWNIRKGLFPAVGAVRSVGTTVIIEDVAFPIARLAEAALELQDLFVNYQYHEAIIFGHALEGNLHFVFTQDFGTPSEIERYRRFMDDVCRMVVQTYDGSLKAEHGTGRNMAPYVEMEWGLEAYSIMQQIKHIFDPKNLLNPGVLINSNPRIHIENLKPMPETDPILDRCIECGFCEAHCPSRDLTLTPRQRIVVQREISRLRATRADRSRLRELEQAYIYQGEQTCAVDGMCAVHCPVDINTGDHTKQLRGTQATHGAQSIATWAARHFEFVTALVRTGLKTADLARRFLGSDTLGFLTTIARRISRDRLPLWNPHVPRGVSLPKMSGLRRSNDKKVVYFPSCISRTMGPAAGDPDSDPLPVVTARVLQKAGYDVICLPNPDAFCCGTPFESKGFFRQADMKSTELETALLEVSRGGRVPVLCDTSPCLYRMRRVLNPALHLFEPAEFICDFLMNLLHIQPLAEPVAVHHTCSTMKMGLEHKLLAVAQACAVDVVIPELVGCCGFAGDRGFSFPELNASALKELKPSLPQKCNSGYSTSRTCEIGLSRHSGIYYKSIMYLVDRCTPKNRAGSLEGRQA